ncbi:hypothetical protein NQ318_002981 [Aromia moschata]|uniref:Uncharacterized protein n=1 Tax=Aromia moschata TaxID=1265417 RepID=A0AAV8YPV7_9CUCU|nr:hypothetical protein NQ318_002981 [Aromia moschata]
MPRATSLMMDTFKFFAVLLLYCVFAAYCYPARPLNERTPELTWQAWLLVDDQNQNQNKQQTHSDGAMRRRITPKSVFIAPTFSPEALPPCAEGYSSDKMGRCIKIIKLDQAAHRKFIIEKLKEKFGPLDYEDEGDEDAPTPGPFQINIPLAGDGDDDSDEETDIAIIVSPTKNFMESIGISLDKRDSLDDENEQETLLRKLAETTTRTTTVTEEPTTLLENGEASTLPEDATATEQASTEDAGRTETRSVKRSTTEEYPSSTAEPTTTPQKNQELQFRFPDEPDHLHDLVRFPEESYAFQTQIPSSVEASDIHDTARFLSEQPSERVVFRDQPHLDLSGFDYGARGRSSSATGLHNRRNREKHSGMFLLPPRWSQPDFQKPLVLRFSRKHTYLDEDQFRNPDYYRSVASDDFAYLFKFKHKQSTHR